MFNVILIFDTFLSFLIVMVLHDVAHAAVAASLGDRTLINKGRLSLAPSSQLAPIGTLVALALSFSYFGVGWGKPLELDARRMRVGPNLGTILVAVAGPLLNVILGVGILFGLMALPGNGALGSAVTACGVHGFAGGLGPTGVPLQGCLTRMTGIAGILLRLEQFGYIFAVTNIVIAILNIIPLQPLDGYLVLFALLPSNSAIKYRSWAPYMELILLVIFFVLPILFGFIGFAAFNPVGAIAGFAEGIAKTFTAGTFDFALLI